MNDRELSNTFSHTQPTPFLPNAQINHELQAENWGGGGGGEGSKTDKKQTNNNNNKRTFDSRVHAAEIKDDVAK